MIKIKLSQKERAALKSPTAASVYAHSVIGGRWPEAEPVIARDAQCAYLYARYLIKGRFLEAEPVIARNADWAYYYARDIIKGPWPKKAGAKKKKAKKA